MEQTDIYIQRVSLEKNNNKILVYLELNTYQA